MYTGKTYTTKCIQRDKLSAVLLQEVQKKYSHQVSVNFNAECTNVVWNSDSKGVESCQLTLVNKNDGLYQTIESHFVLGCDGKMNIKYHTIKFYFSI